MTKQKVKSNTVEIPNILTTPFPEIEAKYAQIVDVKTSSSDVVLSFLQFLPSITDDPGTELKCVSRIIMSRANFTVFVNNINEINSLLQSDFEETKIGKTK